MTATYTPLPQRLLPVATRLARPVQQFRKLSLQEPAIYAMTDLAIVSSITINAGDGVDDAIYKMKQRGVKLLFVVDHNDYIIGIVTLTDISGEKLEKSQQELGLNDSELCILDMMVGIDYIDVLDFEHVKKSRVGDIVETLLEIERQHALVLQYEQSIPKIRGIFSATQINRQLHSPVNFPFLQTQNDIERLGLQIKNIKTA